MKMPLCLFAGLVLTQAAAAVQKVVDVAADFKKRQQAEGDCMYLPLDINGDGRLDKLVFFAYRNGCDPQQLADKRKLCDLYVAAADGKGFVRNEQIDFEDEEGEEGLGSLAVDTALLYVGKVQELGKTALLSIDEFEHEGRPYCVVWAFMWNGTHVRQQKMDEFAAGSQQHQQWQQRYFSHKRLKDKAARL